MANAVLNAPRSAKMGRTLFKGVLYFSVAGYAMHRMFHPKEEPLDMEKLSEAGYGANYFKTRGLSQFYDRAMAPYELFIWRRLRQRLLQNAQGDVLEVGAGSGLNVPHYDDSKVNTLEVTDPASTMLLEAAKKAHKRGWQTWVLDPRSQESFEFTSEDKDPSVLSQLWSRLADTWRGSPPSPAQQEDATTRESSKTHTPLVTVKTMDGERLEYPDNSFDTVVLTKTLCTVDDPNAILLEAQRVCRPGGHMLVLEHGRPRAKERASVAAAWLDRRLGRVDLQVQHRHDWGCWPHRDVEAMLGAPSLHLDVENYETSWLGNVHCVTLRKPKADV